MQEVLDELVGRIVAESGADCRHGAPHAGICRSAD
jgi:hypothetical protein